MTYYSSTRKPKFELFLDAADKWRWRLKAANGTKIATSGEHFASKANAKRAAQNVKDTAPNAYIDD